MSETDGQADLPGRYDGRCGWDKLTPLSTQLCPALAAGKERSRRYLRKVSFLELTLEEED